MELVASIVQVLVPTGLYSTFHIVSVSSAPQLTVAVVEPISLTVIYVGLGQSDWIQLGVKEVKVPADGSDTL